MDKEKNISAGSAEEKGKFFTSRNIAWFAVLLALTVVLQIWGFPITPYFYSAA